MKSILYYREQLKALNDLWRDHFEKILADGVIKYAESIDTQRFLETQETALRMLEDQIVADIEALRTSYREKGALAKGQFEDRALSDEIHRLRGEYQEALIPYREMLSKIRVHLLEIPPNQAHIEKLIAEYRAEMDAKLDEFDEVVFDDFWGVNRHEKALRKQLDRWDHLLKAVNERLDAPTTDAQKAYDRGMQSMLKLVITETNLLLKQ